MAQRVVMCVRDDDAEMVLLETDGTDLTITLDDGIEVTVNALELQAEVSSALNECRLVLEQSARRMAA